VLGCAFQCILGIRLRKIAELGKGTSLLLYEDSPPGHDERPRLDTWDSTGALSRSASAMYDGRMPRWVRSQLRI